MNILQHYKRAVSLSRNTSRMSNADWYKQPLELDVQLHLRVGRAERISAYLYIDSDNYYEKLAGIDYDEFKNKEYLENYLNELLQRKELKKLKSLGVVLHVADELSIASLGPEHQSTAALDELKKEIVDDPGEILEDKTVSAETHSWRIFPYAGAVSGSEIATAVVMSRKHDDSMRLFREIGESRNLPIVTSVQSAPICAVASMPWFSDVNPNGVIGVYSYRAFTLLAFFNPQGDLMMLRNMPHAAGRDYPSNIGSAITATSSAFELESPQINVISMLNHDVTGLIAKIQKTIMSSEIMLIDAREILISQNLPSDIPLEMLVATNDFDIASSSLANNATFRDLQENKWHLQGFVKPHAEELAMFPAQGDMKLLKLSKIITRLGAAIVVLLLGWGAFSIWKKSNTEAWKCEPAAGKAERVAMQKELNDFKHYKNILIDRSKMWTTMELVIRIAPTDSPIFLKDVRHDLDQVMVKSSQKIGLEKRWIINGFTNEKGLTYLESISTRDSIRTVFNSVANSTGNEVFNADVKGRTIDIDMNNTANTSYLKGETNTVGNNSPLAFTIEITQTVPVTDNAAVNKRRL